MPSVGIGLPALVRGPAQGVVGVVLVDLVIVFKDRGALDIERRDRAHQIPQALVVVLHLALAAEEVALLGVLDAVQAAAADIARLVDGDAFAIHLPVADQKAGRRERGDATADEIGRLPVHALRLAGTNERFVVTITVEHRCLPFIVTGCRTFAKPRSVVTPPGMCLVDQERSGGQPADPAMALFLPMPAGGRALICS